MNSGFWLLVALMVALALAFVFYPLAAWRRQRRAMQAQKADPDSPGASAGQAPTLSGRQTWPLTAPAWRSWTRNAPAVASRSRTIRPYGTSWRLRFWKT